MIRRTVQKIGKQLEQLVDREVPITRAFDILSAKAASIEEIVVVEVMREVYQELIDGEIMQQAYADSSTRSARMPAMAFSR
jgi:geranylgeranyl pyrophosphate synthase